MNKKQAVVLKFRERRPSQHGMGNLAGCDNVPPQEEERVIEVPEGQPPPEGSQEVERETPVHDWRPVEA